MTKILIVIGGQGGAGKSTMGRLLFEVLEPSAWIDIDDLSQVRPWVYGADLLALGIENAATLAQNFWRAGYHQVILSGGVSSQRELDILAAAVADNCRILYLWLAVAKPIRDKRRLARARDGADAAEHLDFVDGLMPDPDVMTLRNGACFRLRIEDDTPQAVLHRLIQVLAKEPLALKDSLSIEQD